MEHPLHFWNSFNPIPAGNYFIGSDENDIQTAFDFWRTRLLDQFDPELFKTWLLKEFPRLAYTTELFYMSTYPITQGVYNWFLQDANYSHQPLSNLTLEESKLDHPVWGVTYEDTQIFCDWLSMQLQKKIRLPNEFEWEIAARGPNHLEYPYGNSFDAEKANSIESKINQTTPVNQYPKGRSGFGLYDMAGNVEEWTSSNYSVYPGGSLITDDLVNALGMEYKVLKGGSFTRGGDLTRCARRHGPFPSDDYQYIGFRVVYQN
jgi:formylglycine-generating enzyme required for sulfatase activity